MAELITVNADSQFPVNARDLYAKLEVKTSYKDWIRTVIDYGFIEGTDYEAIETETLWSFKKVSNQIVESSTKRTTHHLTFDMAKFTCLIQRSDIGRELRQYFLDIEKQHNTPEAIISKAIKIAKDTLNNPNAEVDNLLNNNIGIATFDNVSYRDFCNKLRNTLGISEHEVREYLIEQRLIYKIHDFRGITKYKPYTETIDRGLMVVKATPCGDGKLYACNYFTYKGQQMLIDHFAPRVVDAPTA